MVKFMTLLRFLVDNGYDNELDESTRNIIEN